MVHLKRLLLSILIVSAITCSCALIAFVCQVFPTPELAFWFIVSVIAVWSLIDTVSK